MLNKKILIVDDEQPFRALMMTCLSPLRRQGVELLTAENGEFALKMVDAEHPDVVFLDLMMPGLDGMDVCRLIKFNQKFQDIYIIILTARKYPNDRAMASLSGANEFLVKPFEPKLIMERAEYALNMANSTHEAPEAWSGARSLFPPQIRFGTLQLFSHTFT